MKITNVLLGLLLLLCVACDKSEKETPNGFKFKVLKEGDGKIGRPGQILVLDFRMQDSKDSVWTDTNKDGIPLPAIINDSSQLATEPGMIQVLRMLSKGDSVTFTLSFAELLRLNRRPALPGMDTTLIVSYFLHVRDIMEQQAYEEYQAKLIQEKSQKQLAADVAMIDAYLKDKNISAEKTESGLRYVITRPGKGENGKPEQVAGVNYAGYLLSGEYFDTNIKSVAQEKGLYEPARDASYKPYEVTIDRSPVIKGWHETLKLLNKGSRAIIYIPSTLAYGPRQRSEIIKPNSILVFEMEVVELK